MLRDEACFVPHCKVSWYDEKKMLGNQPFRRIWYDEVAIGTEFKDVDPDLGKDRKTKRQSNISPARLGSVELTEGNLDGE